MPNNKKKKEVPVPEKDSETKDALLEKDEKDDELIIDRNSYNVNDDSGRIDKEMETYIVKNLTQKDFKKMREMFSYDKLVVIFRQKSLRQVGDKLKEKHPSLFKKSEMVKFQNIHDTRFKKEQVELINELRKAETGNENRRMTRRRTELEKLSGKGHVKRILDGYDINIFID